MESLDRVKSVIRFQETDRPPVIPELVAVTATMNGISPRDYVRSGSILAECQLSAREKIGHDAVFAMADLCVEAEALGCKLDYPEDNYPHITKPIINDFSDFEKLEIPNPYTDGRMPEIIKAVRIMKERVGGRVPIMGHVIGPMTLLSRIMDIEKMLYMMVDYPEQFREVLGFCMEVSNKFAEALVTQGADGLIVFDPTSSPSVLPEKMFREFEVGLLRELFSTVKDVNSEVITWYSVAGPLQTNSAILDAVGADISTVDYMVPIEVAMKYSALTVINGNIKPYLFLEGSREEIEKEALSLLRATRSADRFILGSGCEIPLYSKRENISALVDAVINYSKDFESINSNVEGLQHEVLVRPFGKKVMVKDGDTLLDAIHTAGIGFTSYCNRSGSCGKCVVKVVEGSLQTPGQIEKLQLQNNKNEPNERLACSVEVEGAMEIYVPYKSRISRGLSKITDEMYVSSIRERLDQYGFVQNVFKEQYEIDDHQDLSLEALKEMVESQVGEVASTEVTMKRLLSLISNGNLKVDAVIDRRKNEIFDFTVSKNIYGLAIDIGTTTISAYLHDIENANLVCVGMVENSQAQWGADVISRTAKIEEDKSLLHDMQGKLVSDINTLISNFHLEYSVQSNQIYDMVVVANPIMMSLLFAEDPAPLARSPFVNNLKGGVRTTVQDVKAFKSLSVNKSCKVEVLPAVSGFVGGDTVSGIIATAMHKQKEISLLIDIGTNGEIVLGNEDNLISTSVAAGPAFEGAQLTNGTVSRSGAIYKVKISSTGSIECKTFGDTAPLGICGTGVNDLLAEFVKNGIINKRGYFINRDRWSNIKDNYFILVPKQETAIFSPIFITAKDIEEIQKGKSAIRSGIDILMEESGLAKEDISNVYLSGSFGNFLDLENAITIGMIPRFPNAKYQSLKNSAGTGARVALLSLNAREDAQKIASSTKHINLALNKSFNNKFIDNMMFMEAE